MKRNESIKQMKSRIEPWDLAVIGGGASGLGVALDALSRGLSVVLVEKSDFAKGTSSRSTKLLHGGVRYLAQGDISLVLEALKERGLLMKNAPHVSGKQSFIIPIYSYADMLKYGVGLKVYDLMARNYRIGNSKWLSKEKVAKRLPTVKKKGLKGGVIYYDGQFNDARLAVNLAQTCAELGGCVLNYTKVTALTKDNQGRVNGIKVKDELNQAEHEIKAKSVVNATGVFADNILQMDNPEAGKTIQPSQGAHLVMDLSFLGGKDALMIPETSDGRVLFGIPWSGKLVVGTTDTLRKKTKMEPEALEEEIDFILENCAAYIEKPPTRKDVLAVFAGLRPLAATKKGSDVTKEISRSHKVSISESNLVTIIGGKWTTFRKMGEDTVDAVARLIKINSAISTSEKIRIHGYSAEKIDGHLSVYGSDAPAINELIKKEPDLGKKLHPEYPHTVAEVVWIARNEMAMKVEDVLARRLRILFLDAEAAIRMAPTVAEVLQKELGYDEDWKNNEISEFHALAEKYLINTKS